MRLVHIIVGLDVGGAEIAMCRLITSMLFCHHTVISLSGVGRVGEELRRNGVKVISLGMKPRQMTIPIFRLTKIIQCLKPDVVQTWMYHADLIGGIAGRFAGVKQIVWGIRNTSIPQGKISITHLIIRIAAILSHSIPSTIICNSEAGMTSHKKIGYNAQKMIVIPNGFDANVLNPVGLDRRAIRLKLGLPNRGLIVGVVARFDSLKGYDIMLNVADWFQTKKGADVTFVFVGKGVDSRNKVFSNPNKIIENGGNLVLLGEQKDVRQVLFAFDVVCSPSRSEGFPNVIAESMLMERPCIVTDVGDSKVIVGETGIIVAPNNEKSIIDAILHFDKMGMPERLKLGRMSRERIIEKYGINKMVSRFEAAYKSICLKNE